MAEHDGKRIAIEVRRIFIDHPSGSLLREGESNKAWVVDWLEHELTAAGLGPLLVLVGFSHDRLPGKERIPFARKALDLIRTNHRPNANEVKLHWREYLARSEYGTTWPEGLEYIRLYRPTGWDRVEVTTTSRGFVASPRDLLQAAIDDKEKDRPDYQADYDETWLLLVAEFSGPGSFIEGDDESRGHQYRFAFDRVFFQGFGNDWFELQRIA